MIYLPLFYPERDLVLVLSKLVNEWVHEWRTASSLAILQLFSFDRYLD